MDFCIQSHNNNILNTHEEISHETYKQQSTNNRPTVPTYYYQLDYLKNYTCSIRHINGTT